MNNENRINKVRAALSKGKVSSTDLYKADSMDIPALMPQNRAMVQFLNEQFHFDY